MDDPAQPLSTPNPRWARYLPPAAGLALAAFASVICLRLAGPVHGVLFGGCAAVVLLVPSLAATRRSALHGLAVAIATSVGAMVGPTLAFAAGDLNGPTFLPAVVVVATLSAAAAGLTLLLLAARLGGSAAAWGVTVVLLLWLGWPVWLSRAIAGREDVVGWLSPAHPLLTLDAALVRQGVAPWAEHRLMYTRLTVLGQHVFPRPPTGATAAVLLHLAVAVPGFALAARRRWHPGRVTPSPGVPGEGAGAGRAAQP